MPQTALPATGRALLPPNALLHLRGLGRPLAVLLPALHERARQRQQIDRHTGRAPGDDDFAVDFWVEGRRDAFADRVVGEQGRG